MTTLSLANPQLRQAFLSLIPRADRADDRAWFEETFVDTGIIETVATAANQIIYGRRGTGKSHLLRIVQVHLGRKPSTIAIYIDARTLGSASLFTDTARSLHVRSIGLFRDIVAIVHNSIMQWIADNQMGNVEEALIALAEIERQLTYTEATTETRKVASSQEGGRSFQGEGAVSMSLEGPLLSANVKSDTTVSDKKEVERETSEVQKILIPVLHQALGRLLDQAEVHQLAVLIDEWATIPFDLQPYLAEFLARTFFPVPKITVKIASLEQRTSLVIRSESGNKVAGLELGGDIDPPLYLEHYYLYEQNPDKAQDTFGRMLFRHLKAKQGREDYFLRDRGVDTAEEFLRVFFQPPAFRELTKAAEGNPRDLMEVSVRAYLRASSQGHRQITTEAVWSAASEWAGIDKLTSVTPSQQFVLHTLIKKLLGSRRRTRFFLLDSNSENLPSLRSLIDERLIHEVNKRLLVRPRSRIVYNLYALDYGYYVGLVLMEREASVREPVGNRLVDPLTTLEQAESNPPVVIAPDIFQLA